MAQIFCVRFQTVGTDLVAAGRVGVANFPTANGDCGDVYELPVAENAPPQIVNAVNFGLNTATGTSLSGGSLGNTRNQNRLDVANDPNDANRGKHVILIVDGDNQCAGGMNDSEVEIRALTAAGITVHIIGVDFDNAQIPWLNSLGIAAGTDPLRTTAFDIEPEVTTFMNTIIERINAMQCTVVSPSPIEDPNRVWASVDGGVTWLDRSEFRVEGQSVTIEDAQCAGAVADDIEVVFGCAERCDATEEVCDYRDNDCDNVVDNGCDDCSAEVCDGVDNDCDEQVDEGCPSE